MLKESCIKSFQNVSEGEVCSLEVAKRFGIRGDNEQHYNDNFGNVKTYSCYDNGIDKPYHFCEANGLPSCLLQEGAGIGFAADPNDTGTCMTSECPTGFTEDSNKCIKPKAEKNILLSKRIDERWYDWFMIPNYYLGNKYSSVAVENTDVDADADAETDSIKYEPCPSGTVPHFKTDPVDGSINANEGEFLNKCIRKDDYFYGKYSDSPEYCPLSWIMRAGATKDDLVKIYGNLIDGIESKKGASVELDKLRKSIKSHVNREIFRKIQKVGFDEYAGIADSPEVEYACRKMSSDTTRLKYAYDICKNIKTRGEKHMVNEYVNDGMTKDTATLRYFRACEACHTVFSDPKGAVAQLENKDPIIFEDVKNTYAQINKAKKRQEKNELHNTINTDAEKTLTLTVLKTIAIAIPIAIITLVIWIFVLGRGTHIINTLKTAYTVVKTLLRTALEVIKGLINRINNRVSKVTTTTTTTQ